MTRYSFKYLLFAAFMLLLLPISSQAQLNQEEPSFKDMAQQMQEMQRMMMEGLQKGNFSDGDSTIVFKMDTSFLGKPSDLFKGHEKELEQMKDFFGGFMDLIGGFEGSFPQGEAPEGSEYLDENGSEDGLLPEERLRQKEQGLEEKDEKKTTTPPKSKKRKTVKI
jgi:hypothetical protein